MILITGSLLARPETFEEARRLSLEHVHRSRAEPGCVSHDVHVDVENPLKLLFVERWADRAALAAHFAVPASRGFVRAVAALVSAPPDMAIYEAAKIEPSQLGG